MRNVLLTPAIATAVLFTLVFAGDTRAALWCPYDLDTLTEKSGLIIEGQIVAVTDATNGRVQVRVDHVYQGNAVKENDTLHIDADGYRKPGSGPFSDRPLETGDRLFWFISREMTVGQTAGQATVWVPEPGGAKFIFKDHVVEFSQEMNPGPPIAEIDRDSPEGKKAPTIAEFRKQIVQSMATVGYFHVGLKIAVAAKDSKMLVQMLQGRRTFTADRPWGQDCLGGEARKALDDLHDYRWLDEALVLGVGDDAGFATQDGLDYLMAGIEDGKLLSARRILYLRALPRPGTMRLDGGTIIRPVNFLLNFAMMARDHAKDQPLRDELFNVLDLWASESRSLDPLASADLLNAVTALKPLYDHTNDVKVEEKIEWITCQVNQDAYRRLQSPCGPVISVASLPDPKTWAKFPGRDFPAELSISFGFPDDANHTVFNQPVMVGHDGVAHAVQYANNIGFDAYTITMNSGSRSGFGCAIHPPASLPAGTYQLYLRFYENGKLLGRSHSVAVTLPG